mmetsp:Transcript_4695/g.21375  ORF Transcript_4695/g.21375 Transcript_4695/m.21375 type:complete len:332 (-) Transcript_4695:787-1782(-)
MARRVARRYSSVIVRSPPRVVVLLPHVVPTPSPLHPRGRVEELLLGLVLVSAQVGAAGSGWRAFAPPRRTSPRADGVVIRLKPRRVLVDVPVHRVLERAHAGGERAAGQPAAHRPAKRLEPVAFAASVEAKRLGLGDSILPTLAVVPVEPGDLLLLLDARLLHALEVQLLEVVRRHPARVVDDIRALKLLILQLVHLVDSLVPASIMRSRRVQRNVSALASGPSPGVVRGGVGKHDPVHNAHLGANLDDDGAALAARSLPPQRSRPRGGAAEGHRPTSHRRDRSRVLDLPSGGATRKCPVGARRARRRSRFPGVEGGPDRRAAEARGDRGG